MALAIVHLSDLHIRTSDSPILSRANAIANAIVSVSLEELEVILVWSGDIAFSGKSEEYRIATGLLVGLEDTLKQHPRVIFLGAHFVPGNHDCDFTQSGDARSPLTSSLPGLIDQLDPSGDTVRQMTKVQEAFFVFLRSRGIDPSNQLIWNHLYAASETSIFVRCCNSAWTSQLPEAPKLLFPSNVINESRAQLTITVLHHPFTWFEPANGKAFRRKLEIDSDLILTGHEHDPDSFARASREGSVHYLEGGALQAANVQTGFTVSLIDMAESAIRLFSFTWSDPIYSRSEESTQPFIRKQRAIVNRFVRSADFERKLNEVTTPFSHPRKELRLSDIYVRPPLTLVVPGARGKTSEQVIAAEAVLEYILAEKVVRISAPTGYGKSALARSLCRDLLDHHSIVPVYFDTSLISGHELGKVSESLEKAFSKQYSLALLEHFRQLSSSKKAIVFDDWERLRFNDGGKARLLKSLISCSDYLIIFDDTSAFLQQLNQLTTEADVPKPKLCELRQYGYQLRGSLIEKWHRLGRTFEVSESTLAHDISVSEHLLDSLVGRGIVPSTPLFVLSALQMQREATNSGGDYGSYGHIYQALITSRLSKHATKNTPLKLIFLSMLAFRMFENHFESLSLSQIREVARAYEDEYSYDVEPKSLLREIAETGLVRFNEESFSFEYRYVYYYSVAYAIKNNAANEQTRAGAREHLSRLARQAHSDDNANILIFYMYLSKDRVLMDEVLANAQKIFVSTSPCNLESDLGFINQLLKAPIPLDEPSENFAQNLLEHRVARDEANALRANPEANSDLKEFSEVDVALRSLEIMGQVLKNFPSDLRRDIKLSLTKESYALGLRSMGSFLSLLQGNREVIREVLASKLAEETAYANRSLAKQQQVLDEIIIFFAQVGIYAIVKKVTASLGTEELRHTYDEVRSELGEEQIATRLIDLSIRLDHFGSIPEADIFDLERRLRDNASAWTILSMLVSQHIALFPTHWKIRQKLIDVFKFSRTTGLPSERQLLPNK